MYIVYHHRHILLTTVFVLDILPDIITCFCFGSVTFCLPILQFFLLLVVLLFSFQGLVNLLDYAPFNISECLYLDGGPPIVEFISSRNSYFLKISFQKIYLYWWVLFPVQLCDECLCLTVWSLNAYSQSNITLTPNRLRDTHFISLSRR